MDAKYAKLIQDLRSGAVKPADLPHSQLKELEEVIYKEVQEMILLFSDVAFHAGLKLGKIVTEELGQSNG